METSFVWKHFVRNSRELATCKFCKKELKCKGSSTTGLRRHLKSIHNFGRKASTRSESTESQSIVAEEKKHIPTSSNMKNCQDCEIRRNSSDSTEFTIEQINSSQSPQKVKRNVLLELINMQKEKKDEDALFFESFLPTIRNLSLQDKMQFKMEFQQLLYKYMFKDTDLI